MKPAPFAYHAPTDLASAVHLLAEIGEGARPLAGGQSLMPMLNLRLARPEALVDLNRIAGLDYHRVDGGTLVVGALCRERDIEKDAALLARCAAIADAVPLIGHVGIRNRGTVVGSLAHADPAAEWPVLALLLDAEVVAKDRQGRRTIGAREFFRGLFTSDLRPSEIAVEARFRLPGPGTGSAFVEVARRHGDFALGTAAAAVTVDAGGAVIDRRLVLGGFDSVPVVVTPDPARVAGEINPVDDIHATAAYRSKLAQILARRALALAEQRARQAETDGRKV
jgi:carbon-monoxide dehydrogenase medium subunit